MRTARAAYRSQRKLGEPSRGKVPIRYCKALGGNHCDSLLPKNCAFRMLGLQIMSSLRDMYVVKGGPNGQHMYAMQIFSIIGVHTYLNGEESGISMSRQHTNQSAMTKPTHTVVSPSDHP